jgi:hypothetical protein
MHMQSLVNAFLLPPPPPQSVTPRYYRVFSFLNEQENVKKLAFPPADDTQVLVCGLPSVYESLCGPQSQKSLAPMSVLARLGYSQDMVYKF